MTQYYSIEAESSFLGCLLLNKELVYDTVITPEHFYYEPYNVIFSSILALRDREVPLDTVTLSKELGERLEDVGGFGAITKLAGSVPGTGEFKAYEQILQEKYVFRSGIKKLHDIRKDSFDDAAQFVNTIREVADSLEGYTKREGGLEHVRYAISEQADEMMDRSEGKIPLGKVTLGIDLTQITGGWQDQDLVILAARPSVGKTAAMLEDAKANAKNGVVVAMFSLEMPRKKLVERMISSEALINGDVIKKAQLNDEEWQRYTMAASLIRNMDMYIDDRPGLTVQEIRKEVRKLRKEHPDREMIVYIDYLQLISGGMKFNNRNDEVGYVSSTLKQVARQNKCPVISLAQLSRSVEQRQDKRPINSDLRDSGNIEQDADIIIFLYRDDYYNAETEKKNIIEFIVSKNRNGSTGTAEMVNIRSFSKFSNLERISSDMFEK